MSECGTYLNGVSKSSGIIIVLQSLCLLRQVKYIVEEDKLLVAIKQQQEVREDWCGGR